MADRYWVGGTDNWNATAGTKWATTSGGAGGASVPTLSDNVFFDAASGAVTVTITATANCDNLNFTGFTGTIAGTSALNVYGSLTLSTGMTRSWSGTLTMRATTTGKTITTNGKTLANITFAGAGGEWILQDAFTTTAAITHTNGTLNTNGVAVSCTGYANTGTLTRVLTLGASVFTCTGTAAWSIASSTGMTLNANTSSIVASGATAGANEITFAGAGFTYYDVSATGTSQSQTFTITGANTFNNLSVTAPSTEIKDVIFSANQTVNSTLTVAGSAITRRIYVQSDIDGQARTLTVATLSGDNADYSDITLAGAASGSSPAAAGDRSGNTNIVFPAAKTVYWNLSGIQLWTANGWALSSGGSPATANFPLAQDTVIFDNTGAAGTVSVQGGYAASTLNMSGRTSAMTFNALSIGLYGDLSVGTGVTVAAVVGNISFRKRSGTQIITSNGVNFGCGININNITGTVQLADSIAISAPVQRTLTVTSGTFDAVSYNVTTNLVSITGSTTRTLNMGSGTWTLSGTGTVWNANTTTGLTFNKGSANIVLSNTTTSARTFAGGGLTYNKLTIGGATGTSTLTFTGSNVFSEIDSTKTVAHTISFTSGTTTTVTTWSVNGSSGNLVSIRAVTSGSPATLAKAGGGSVIVNYADIKDNTGSPVATWFATNSVDSGNNLNWVFLAAAASAAFLMFFS